jgi:hypothetical protein
MVPCVGGGSGLEGGGVMQRGPHPKTSSPRSCSVNSAPGPSSEHVTEHGASEPGDVGFCVHAFVHLTHMAGGGKRLGGSGGACGWG